jgi:hypothetical protein
MQVSFSIVQIAGTAGNQSLPVISRGRYYCYRSDHGFGAKIVCWSKTTLLF